MSDKLKQVAEERKHLFALAQEAADHSLLELMYSYEKFPDYNSYHEGYAVIKEEVDELWDEIKTNPKSEQRIEGEAIQVAATALKLLVFMKKKAREPVLEESAETPQ